MEYMRHGICLIYTIERVAETILVVVVFVIAFVVSCVVVFVLITTTACR